MVSLTAALFSNTTTQNANNVSASATRLASGQRLAQASDDVAALAIGSALSTQVTSLRAGLSNASQASSLLQVADGGLSQQQDILDRLKALSIQSSSGQLTDTDRGALNQEFQGLTQELNRIAGNTNFNGVNLLDGTANTSITLGASSTDTLGIALNDTTTNTLFAGQALDISTQSSAAVSAAALDQAITSVTSARANVGALQSRVDSSSNEIQSAIAAQDAARSETLDTDIAAESTNFAAQKVLLEASIATRAQSNKLSSNLLKLVQ